MVTVSRRIRAQSMTPGRPGIRGSRPVTSPALTDSGTSSRATTPGNRWVIPDMRSSTLPGPAAVVMKPHPASSRRIRSTTARLIAALSEGGRQVVSCSTMTQPA